MDFWELFTRVRDVLPANQEIYLVGGAVRDRLLGKEVHDLDFVVKGDCRKAAQKVSRSLNAPFFVMDAERLTSRVIYDAPNGRPIPLDFIAMIQNDLEVDLQRRDFTINAIACRIESPDEYIDPCRGISDLQGHILRACSPGAMKDDPLRVLRGIRLAYGLDLAALPDTETAMKEAVSGLEKISPERKRDELFRLLEGKNPAEAVEKLGSLGALPFVLPEVDMLKNESGLTPGGESQWTGTLLFMKKLHRVLGLLEMENPAVESEAQIVQILEPLQSFTKEIRAHLSTEITPGRSIHSLLLFASLYSKLGGVPKEQIQPLLVRADALRLSAAEKLYLHQMMDIDPREEKIFRKRSPLERRQIYHFFKKHHEAGIARCLFVLADRLAENDHRNDKRILVTCVLRCQELMQAWWYRYEEVIRPPLLLDGNQIKVELKLHPGPLIGDLLEALEEAQAAGEVVTRNQAILYLRKQKRDCHLHPAD